jgi:hypothetical protein
MRAGGMKIMTIKEAVFCQILPGFLPPKHYRTWGRIIVLVQYTKQQNSVLPDNLGFHGQFLPVDIKTHPTDREV